MEENMSAQEIINNLIKTIVDLKIENSTLKAEIRQLKNINNKSSYAPKKPEMEGLTTRRF